MDRAIVAAVLFARLDQACIAQVRSRTDVAFDPPQKRIARLEAMVPLLMEMSRQALRDTVARAQQAQIERARQVAADDHKPGRADIGTAARRKRGEIAMEERADIGSDAEFKPSILGARRADPLRVLLGIKSVQRPHDGADPANARRWVSAQVYRNLIEIAGGASLADKMAVRVDRSGSAGGFSDRIIDATTMVRTVKIALGQQQAVIRWVVEEYSDLDTWATMTRVTHEIAKDKLLAGLDALAIGLAAYEGPGAE